jgi:hypothetical protein
MDNLNLFNDQEPNNFNDRNIFIPITFPLPEFQQVLPLHESQELNFGDQYGTHVYSFQNLLGFQPTENLNYAAESSQEATAAYSNSRVTTHSPILTSTDSNDIIVPFSTNMHDNQGSMRLASFNPSPFHENAIMDVAKFSSNWCASPYIQMNGHGQSYLDCQVDIHKESHNSVGSSIEPLEPELRTVPINNRATGQMTDLPREYRCTRRNCRSWFSTEDNLL